jgi:hypothetical protein
MSTILLLGDACMFGLWPFWPLPLYSLNVRWAFCARWEDDSDGWLRDLHWTWNQNRDAGRYSPRIPSLMFDRGEGRGRHALDPVVWNPTSCALKSVPPHYTTTSHVSYFLYSVRSKITWSIYGQNARRNTLFALGKKAVTLLSRLHSAFTLPATDLSDMTGSIPSRRTSLHESKVYN